jgi:hypothetical protein
MELVVDEIDMLIVTYAYLGSDWQLTNFCMSWKYCTRINFAARTISTCQCLFRFLQVLFVSNTEVENQLRTVVLCCTDGKGAYEMVDETASRRSLTVWRCLIS